MSVYRWTIAFGVDAVDMLDAARTAAIIGRLEVVGRAIVVTFRLR
jgi:hypothetical protein